MRCCLHSVIIFLSVCIVAFGGKRVDSVEIFGVTGQTDFLCTPEQVCSILITGQGLWGGDVLMLAHRKPDTEEGIRKYQNWTTVESAYVLTKYKSKAVDVTSAMSAVDPSSWTKTFLYMLPSNMTAGNYFVLIHSEMSGYLEHVGHLGVWDWSMNVAVAPLGIAGAVSSDVSTKHFGGLQILEVPCPQGSSAVDLCIETTTTTPTSTPARHSSTTIPTTSEPKPKGRLMSFDASSVMTVAVIGGFAGLLASLCLVFAYMGYKRAVSKRDEDILALRDMSVFDDAESGDLSFAGPILLPRIAHNSVNDNSSSVAASTINRRLHMGPPDTPSWTADSTRCHSRAANSPTAAEDQLRWAAARALGQGFSSRSLSAGTDNPFV